LQEYLQSHPEVREEFKENPNAFMRQENRYDWREDDRDRGHGISTGDRGDRNRMVDADGRGELTSFGPFLGGHSTVAEQLSKDLHWPTTRSTWQTTQTFGIFEGSCPLARR